MFCKHFIHKVLCIIVVLFSATTVADDSNLTPVSLQLKWHHSFQFAGYYAAKELGFYAEEGLDVEIRPYNPSSQVVAQVVTEEADYGIGDSDVLASYVNGNPITAIAAIFQDNPLVLLSKKSSNINTVSDLLGKRLMFDPVGVGGAPIRAMLAKNGINPSQYTLLKHSYNTQDLVDGKVDAMTAYSSSQPFELEQQHVSYTTIDPKEYGINFYGDILFTSHMKVENSPQEVEKFKRASLKGWNYAITHQKQLIDIIQSKYNSSKTNDALVFEAKKMIELMEYPLIEVGYMNQDRWEYIADIFEELGLTNKAFDYESFVYIPKVKTYIYWFTPLIFLIFILAIWLARKFQQNNQLLYDLKQEVLKEKLVVQQLADKAQQLVFQQSALDEHAIVSIADVKGNIIYANDKFEAMSQYTSNELLGQNHRMLKSDLHPDSFFKDMWKTIAGGKVWHGEIQNKAKDGSLYWVASTIVPQLNEQGKPEQYIAIRTDITDVKQSKSRLGMTVEATGDGTWDWDIATGKFIVSSLYRGMLGFEPIERVTDIDEWVESVHPDDILRVQKVLSEYFENKTDTYKVELRLKCKDGSWKWVLCRGKVLSRDGAGEPLMMMGIHTDISQRKEMEIDLVAEKEVATKANKAKSEFLSSMSHELRTPLNAILGFGQLLDSDSESSLSEDQQESVDFILSSGEHLLSLINDVLELSVIEAGELELSIENVSLADVMSDTLSLFYPISTKANIKLQALPDIPLQVNADYMKLKQVLINLISNAIKYNKPNGSVTVGYTQTNHDTAKVTITDTGIGIAEGQHDKVFGAFNRLGQETSTIEGTGIGLVVTKNLMEMMGGTIGFDSTEGQGSTFWIELPLAGETSIIEEVETVEEAEIQEAQEVTDKHVLYIEDNPANRRLMEAFFNRQTHTLHMVESAELGWKNAMENDYDLILMDIHLPGMDGKELTQKLREADQYKNKPIIAVTAAAMKHDVDSVEGLFDGYVTKPLDFSELQIILNKHLQG